MVGHRVRGFAGWAVAAAMATVSCSGLPGASASTQPVRPLSHEAYQAQLTAAANLFGAALDHVANAGSPDDVVTALEGAGSISPRAANLLAEGLAPPEVYDSTGRFVQHMRLLGDGLQGLAGRAQNLELCAGPSAMAAASSLDHAQKLRAAVQDVAARGYQVRELIPPAGPSPDRHGANGSLLVDAGNRGSASELVVSDNTDQDAVVTMLLDGAPRFALYVTAGSTATAPGIPNGAYAVDWTQGRDWDPTLKIFTRMCSFQGLDDPVHFDGPTEGRLSLKPTPGGQPTHRISPKDYPKV